MYNEDAIMSYLILMFNILLLMIAVGYFGVIAKDKTKYIKSQTYKIVLYISILKLVVTLISLLNRNNGENIYLLLIVKMLVILITMLIYVIYIRVGQYLCNKNSLKGSIILNHEKFTKDIKYSLIPIIFLMIWNIIFYYSFNGLNENKYVYTEVATLINICILAPITEEIIYRHLFMSIITDIFGNGDLVIKINIFISTVIFSCSHVGIFENNLLKFIQILPLGLVLSYLNIKKGLEYSILTHMLFNIFNILIFFIISYL